MLSKIFQFLGKKTMNIGSMGIPIISNRYIAKTIRFALESQSSSYSFSLLPSQKAQGFSPILQESLDLLLHAVTAVFEFLGN